MDIEKLRKAGAQEREIKHLIDEEVKKTDCFSLIVVEQLKRRLNSVKAEVKNIPAADMEKHSITLAEKVHETAEKAAGQFFHRIGNRSLVNHTR